MSQLNRLARTFSILLALAVLAAPAPARTRKGEKFLKDGRLAEARRDFDAALALYEQAVAQDPEDAAYQLAVRRVRFQAGQAHVDKGMRLRDEGNLEEAAAEFQKAFATDPASSLAANEWKRTLAMIEARKRKESKGAEGDKRSAGPTAGEELEKRMAALQPAPELKPLSRHISTLKMNNQPIKVLFETLSKLAGINVIWDPEYQSTGKQYSVDLSNIRLEEALDHLALLTKTYWKALSTNTVFLTNDNVTKRRDHEDMVVKTFYLKNLTTPQELQEIATILRSVTDIRRVFTYNAQNIVMVRGTVDQVTLAEKLVTDLDKPKAEVVIDVIVMEANRSRTRDLAATFVSGGTNGLRLPVSFSPRSTLGLPGGSTGTTGTGTGTGDGTGLGTGTGTGTGSTSTTSGLVQLTKLGDLRLDDWAIAVPNALLQALMSDRGTRVMVSPQIRATHGVKATLKIGDKYPYATGSFQPGVGAIGVSPLVSTQFQFADVGVNVDVTPNIHGADEVTMQVDVDISNIRDRIDVGGLSQPVIGQRKFTHNVRMRQGEVSLLGGLNQNQDTRSLSGTPGLAQVPILGRLFSAESVERSTGELLVALVPHIVRAPDISDLNLRGVAAGTDTVVKVNVLKNGTEEPAKAEAAKPAAEAPKAEPPKTEAPKAAVPAAEAPKPAMPAALAGLLGLPGGGPGARAQPGPSAPKLTMQTAASAVKLASAVTVTVQLDNAADLFGAPMRVKWDPKILRLNEAARGTLFNADGQPPVFTRNIRNDEGEATIVLNRAAGAAGVSGTGSLVVLTFQAVGKGATTVTLPEVTLRNSQMQPIATEAPSATVTVE